MKILFITHNKGKVSEFQEILGKDNVEHKEFEYPEIQSDDPVEIAKAGAKYCAEKFGKAVVVEDSGIF
ncbi:non-canonical purine NTP pyrophosphatase, partial [Candidatus Woesearchaeota archaeon]|nr:non-canonical purine NTP pyrophosphatase [Candidatus Woesearchaeota archaeon]